MSVAPATTKYPLTMRLLHWLIGILILGMIASGWYMHGLPDEEPLKEELYSLHKSFGITLLPLILIRLLVRLSSPIPELPPQMSWWEKVLSKLTHFLLYLLMFSIPLSGIIMMDYLGIFPLEWFGVFTMPDLIPDDMDMFEQLGEVHEILAYSLLGLILLHILGALKHRFMDKGKDTDVLKRMI
ncbi:cytochrome b [Kangiella sediminilitoris]|uniref:Cytochrome B561 n=1 Tax=Kangiella sediminilitoris TaxID=1144748 RepID=A0A1B3BCU4_9GAMM|nr:cytochrome b [Kangiella sediminilitoris]AOE50631.1 Cytochrome B561 [Kangiella sediminilitoris]